MKVLISVDMEGIAGLEKWSDIKDKNSESYFRICKLMTNEVNIAAKSCFNSGVNEVFVCDAHSSGDNLVHDLLDSRVIMVKKDPDLQMMSGVIGCDFVLFIGYHGKSKSNSFAAHTNSSKLMDSLSINDVEISEAETNALIGKQLGVKTIFISGTDLAVEELKVKLPSVRSIVSLKSIGEQEAISVPIEQHLENLYLEVCTAIKEHRDIDFIDGPITNLKFKIILKSNKIIEYFAVDILKGYSQYRQVIARQSLN